MEKILDFIKNNKIKFLITIILLIFCVSCVFLFSNIKKKEYSITEVLEYKYYVLNKDDKYGVIDTSGNTVIEPKYDNIKIPNPEKPIFICESVDKTIVLNERKEQLFNDYDEVKAILINGIVSSVPYEKTVLTYKKNGKYGIISYEGKEITKPIYDEIRGLENKESELLVKKDGKYGVINAKGAKLIDIQYDNIVADGFYTENEKYGLSGYIVSNKTTDGYKYGYIDCKYKLILDIEYDVISRIVQSDYIKDVYIIACKNGQYGVIKNSKTLINYAYQGIEYDSNNHFFELQRNEKYGIVDNNGKVILPTEYNDIEIKGIYIQAQKSDENEILLFNLLGEKIDNIEYSSIEKTDCNNYYITINQEGFYGVIDSQNKELIKNKYNYIEYLFDEYFIVSNEKGNLGVININDEILIDFSYDVLQKIDNTRVVEAKILKENRIDLYSEKMDKISSFKDSYIYNMDKYIEVYSKNLTRYFDFVGKELNNKDIFTNNLLFSSKKDDKWGFVDINNNIVIDYKYDKVTEFNIYGYAGIMNNGKWGVIDVNGNVIQEPIYNLEETNLDPEFLGKYYKVYYGYGECYYTNKMAD